MLKSSYNVLRRFEVNGYPRETSFEEVVVEAEVREITITSSELEVPRGH